MKLCLSNETAFTAWPKSQDKNLNILRMKRVFKMKWKTFFDIFIGLSLKQIKQMFLEGESPSLKNSWKKLVLYNHVNFTRRDVQL